MPKIFSLLRPRQSRIVSTPTIATGYTPSMKVVSNPITRQLIVQGNAVLPDVGMYSVVLLNGAQILVQYTQILPYVVNGADDTDTSYAYVRPKPDVFEMKAGRYLTIFVGETHVVALIKQILSHPYIDSTLPPLETDVEHVPHTGSVSHPDTGSPLRPPHMTHYHEKIYTTEGHLKKFSLESETPISTAHRHDVYPTPDTALSASPSLGKHKRSSRRTSNSLQNSFVAAETHILTAQNHSAQLATPQSLVLSPNQTPRNTTRRVPRVHFREKELPELPELAREVAQPNTHQIPVTMLGSPVSPLKSFVVTQDQHISPLLPVPASQSNASLLAPVSFAQYDTITPRDQHIAPVPPNPTPMLVLPYAPRTHSPLKKTLSKDSYAAAPAIVHSAENFKVSQISPNGTSFSTGLKRELVAIPSTRTPSPKLESKAKKNATKRVRTESEKPRSRDGHWKGKEQTPSPGSPPTIQIQFSNDTMSVNTYDIVRRPDDLETSVHRDREQLPTKRYVLGDILSPWSPPPEAYEHGIGPLRDFIPVGLEGTISEAPSRKSTDPLPPLNGSPLTRVWVQLDIGNTPAPIGAERHRILAPKEHITPPIMHRFPLAPLPTMSLASAEMSRKYSEYASREPIEREVMYAPPDKTGYARSLGASLGLTVAQEESDISSAAAVDICEPSPPAVAFSIKGGPTVYLLQASDIDTTERDDLLKHAIASS
ncbi:hypothetical protein CVT25_013145 [Psilocybe cyanescens]|uniref:Uncharacterized protein n=1 Tax=Psilocybe cyanescens TaxID=93625 RepID=A0A409XK52_PSICY|nr:hypothetical protein CVT25_013145 [Psilocybe cyanescens]